MHTPAPMAIQELRRILFVEDEPDIQEVTRLSLELAGGFSVRTCTSGAEALTALDEFKPDLVLLDVMMPGMDGPATLRAIHDIKGYADLPVVFLTAKFRPHEIGHYVDLGAIDVIAKPIDPLDLPAQLQAIWTRYHANA